MILQLALRNLGRNRRRSLLTISSLVVSSSLLILILGVISGMLSDILASATEQYHGHLVISRREYQDNRNLFQTFEQPGPLAGKLRERSGVLGASPRLRAFGLLSHQDVTVPIEMLGVLPEEERLVTNLGAHLTAGTYLSREDGEGALIGLTLADRLGVAPGDELVFFTQSADGSIGNALLRVEGVFSTLDNAVESRLVMVNLPWLQDVMVMPGRVHEIAVRLADARKSAVVAGDLQVGLADDLRAEDWGKLIPEMQQVMAAFETMRIVIIVIFYLAAGLGILNTFFMAVFERTREFGVLLAMGMHPWQIRAMILLESLIMACVSLFFGLILGVLLTLYMVHVGVDMSGYMSAVSYGGGIVSPHLKAVVQWPNFLLPVCLLLIACLLAGFIPANRAARLRPVDAIRGE